MERGRLLRRKQIWAWGEAFVQVGRYGGFQEEEKKRPRQGVRVEEVRRVF